MWTLDADDVLARGAAEPAPSSSQQRLIRDCEELYDELAPDYDRHLQDECDYRSPARVAEAVAKLRPTGRWLDLGAGTGLVGEALALRKLFVQLIAMDVSAAMLEEISCPLYVERHRADVLGALPVPPASCSGVVAAGLMEYILDTRALVRRAAEALRPGGWFVFTFCPNNLGRVCVFDEEADLHCHDADLVEAQLREHGFSIARRNEFRAYVNGEQGWIRHRLLVARSGQANP